MKLKFITILILIGFIQSSQRANSDAIVVDGSTTVGPIAKAFAEYYKVAINPDINVTVSESGSGNGAKGVMNKTCDVGICYVKTHEKLEQSKVVSLARLQKKEFSQLLM